ncbi:ThiF family adenylyltransferase [Streptosporangium sp. CA-115845]|uniref:ThiF family adenylyltransferase n=1 Tax=Streptosporangium sp. CA-115845 TaxID=3240071 RepID=UPI003D8A879A
MTTALKVLLGDLRRLPIEISLDPGNSPERLSDQVIADIVEGTLGIDSDRPVTLTADTADLNIHLGPHPPAETAISAVPDGHGVRLRHAGASYPSLSAAGTGLGAVTTAASLTAEIFKTITNLKPGACRQLIRLDFCPVTLGTQPGAFSTSVSELPTIALVGAGAVGTAIATILDALGASGQITVVDPETYDTPNVTTYSLGSHTDAENQILKVDLLARELNRAGRLQALPIKGTAQDLIISIDEGKTPWPLMVLSGVDSITARHEIQRIYADFTLDGSTGGQAGTTLALHEALPLGPCLRCYYPQRATTGIVSAETRLHQVTGLPIARIAQGDHPLSLADLSTLSIAAQELLRPHLGKPVCGLSNLLALSSGAADGYRPSATFVAQQAASLVVGALIARTTGFADGPPRHVEYDARFGPQKSMLTSRKPRPSCDCQSEQQLIQRIRRNRAQPGGAAAGRRRHR